MDMEKEIVDLLVDDIIPNRFQPREVFDEKALQELAASIKEHGVIQPIIVRKINDKYEIIAGERRYKASIMAGLNKIPAIIRNLDDKESSKVALLENLQRKDLSAIEEARTYQKILDLDNMTQEELGKTMGKSQAAVANKLRLLALPDEVQEALLNNKISERHARSLLNVSDKEKQIELLNKIIENKMTVRDLETEIKALNGNPTEPTLIIEEPPQAKEASSFITIPDMNPELKTDNPSTPLVDEIKTTLPEAPVETNPSRTVDSLVAPTTQSEASPVESNHEATSNFRFIPTFEEDKEVEVESAPAPKVETTPNFDFLANTTIQSSDDSTEGGTTSSVTPSLPPKDDIESLEDEPKNPEPYQPFTNTANLLNEFHMKNENKEVEPISSTIQTPISFEAETPVNEIPNLRTAINTIRDLAKKLEDNGFVVNLDEMDFENKYQINISIDKNK